MKTSSYCLALILTASAAFATDAVPAAPDAQAAALPSGNPELRGVIVTNSEKRFLLSSAGAARSEWVKLGDSFQGWNVAEYGAKDGVLVLRQEGGAAELRLGLASNPVASADVKATLEQAQAVLKKMHFAEMFPKLIEQQKQGMMALLGQSMGQRKLPPGTTKEEMIAFQKKIQDTIWGSLTPEDFEQSVAQVYSEVFSPDELNGLADFYDTSAGQALIAKTPQVQQKMMSEVVMPMMAEAMPKIQQMQKEFAAAHAPKATGASQGVVSP